MELVYGIHALSDIVTFVAYAAIAYSFLYFAHAVPQYVMLVRLYTAFIFFCGLVHLSHVLFGPRALNMPVLIAVISFLTALISVWASFVTLRLLPLLVQVASQSAKPPAPPTKQPSRR